MQSPPEGMTQAGMDQCDGRNAYLSTDSDFNGIPAIASARTNGLLLRAVSLAAFDDTLGTPSSITSAALENTAKDLVARIDALTDCVLAMLPTMDVNQGMHPTTALMEVFGMQPSQPELKFLRRMKSDGKTDSLCPRCHITVASSTWEADLDRAEIIHQCDATEPLILEATRKPPLRVNWVPSQKVETA